MGCTGRYATADQYEALLCAGLDLADQSVVATIELFLDIAAADIHAALASVGACDCTLAAWATLYLAKLNILDAAVIQNCPCGNSLDQDKKEMFLDWLNDQFELIRTGKLVLCEGETSSDYPAFGSAELNLTDWSAVEIVAHAQMRNL